jgi:uncharacterized protein
MSRLESRLRDLLRERRLRDAQSGGDSSFGRLRTNDGGDRPNGGGDRADGAGDTDRVAKAADWLGRLQAAAAALDGDLQVTPSGPIIVIDRFYPANHHHGLVRLGDVPGRTLAARPELALIGGRPEPIESDPRALLFIDLETTGLAGGAGTYAFLVGCAFFEPAGFRVRQYFLPGYQHERPLLDALGLLVRQSAGLVSYNGKTFDIPVLETRYQFNRLTPPFGDMAHVDMLHVARRFWRGAAASPGAWPESDGCRLGRLERVLFGVRRVGDVPGFEIPGRYFDFMRSGDAGPLEPVLKHNRLDLLSLALMTARALQTLDRAPDASTSARESLGAGRLLERAGRLGQAERCFRDAADRARSERGPDAIHVRTEALRLLAVGLRRAGRYDEAADAWHAIAGHAHASPAAKRGALEALAIHYEHRATNLDQARRYARLSLVEEVGTGRMEASRYRLARLDRKLAGRASGPDAPVGTTRLPQL